MGKRKGAERAKSAEKIEKIDLKLHDKPPSSEEKHSKSEARIKREKKKRLDKITRWTLRTLIGAAILLVLTAAGFVIFSKVIITIDDELTLEIIPPQQSMILENEEEAQINLEIQNNNFWQCNVRCNFTLVDLRNNTIIQSETDILKHNEKVKKSFDVTAPRRGSGQILYSFQAECNNIKSVICLTAEAKRFEQAIAAINYELSGEDQATKTELKPRLEVLLTNLNRAEEIAKDAQEKNLRLPEGASESEEINALFSSEDARLEEISQRAHGLKQYWDVEDYESLREEYSEDDLHNLTDAIGKITFLREKAVKIMEFRNDNIDFLVGMERQKPRLRRFMDDYAVEPSQAKAQKALELENAAENIHNEYLLLSLQAVHSVETSHNTIISSAGQVQKVLDSWELGAANATFLSILAKNTLMIKEYEGLEDMNDTSLLGCEGLRTYSSMIDQSNLLSSLIYEASPSSSDTGSNESNENNTSPPSQTVPPDEVRNAEAYILSEALKASIAEIMSAELDSKALVMQVAKGFEVSDDALITVPSPEALSLALIDNAAHKDALARECRDDAFNNSIIRFESTTNLLDVNFTKLESKKINILPINDSRLENLTVTLRNNSAMCCELGNCAPCCDLKDDKCKQEDYPVLLIHGHAFNKDTHPNAALNVFDEMEQEMAGDGFISLGQLDLEYHPEDRIAGVWGRPREPVVTKASYYFITYYSLGDYSLGIKKDESIENYAIRLKEIIDVVQEKTGKDKVDLVAHSMGGLVAREYINLFGDANVHKLITVNTPNNGVSGRVKEWCTLFGSKKECDDLSEGSIFLTRLNARDQVSGIDAYAIRSTGCPMDGGKNGDGVVTNESAYLPGAKNYEIKGICTDTLKSDLHMNAMDPRFYPEVYDLILEILKG
ncbi:alpha/beta fold hydrolase [Candidatus Woesearchaeota archaeon]|nr:alpha/beta fold hydrolase [Candidatus Woesearchaeota archaeon]